MSLAFTTETFKHYLGNRDKTSTKNVLEIEYGNEVITITPDDNGYSSYLTNSNGHHNKFYELFLGRIYDGIKYTPVVVGRYGRIGNSPRIFCQYFLSESSAKLVFLDKLRSKIAKGYSACNNLQEYINLTDPEHFKSNPF